MANIMEMFKATNKPSRDGYDMSKTNRFTAKAGELLPVYSKLVMKGDKWSGNVKFITNTRPLNSDAYTTIREYYNWYFVPLHLLWDKFNEWSVDLKDNVQVAASINGNNPLSDKHPYFTTGQLYDAVEALDALTEDNNKLNTFGFERGQLSRKLLHYLGYGDYYKSRTTMLKNADVNPWRILAYQKIYQDFYRDSQWESARPALFNLNYMDGSSGAEQIATDEIDYTKWTMFDVRYANWQKDYFMGLLPNSQYGDAALVDMGSVGITLSDIPYDIISNPIDGSTSFSIVGGVNNSSGQEVNVSVPPSSKAPRYETGSGWSTLRGETLSMNSLALEDLRVKIGLPASGSSASSLTSAFTILALRQAEALQKFKEIKLSNKQDFPSQAMAQFGVRPSNAYSHRAQWLKGMDSTININPVVNNNLAEGNTAVTRGRGIGAGAGSFTFDSDVDGILMCIYHAVPVLDYSITGIHPDNTKTYFSDYAQPIFDKTGMQQIDMVHLLNHFPDTAVAFTNETLLGYGPAYLDYKTDYPEIHGAFYNGDTLPAWVSPINQDYIVAWLEGNQSGDYSVWKGLNSSFFKVNPHVLDPIFAGEEVDSSVNTDHFWCNAFFDMSAVRNLDRDGLPY